MVHERPCSSRNRYACRDRGNSAARVWVACGSYCLCDAMIRIAYRALVLLVCSVTLVSLIAARPLTLPPAELAPQVALPIAPASAAPAATVALPAPARPTRIQLRRTFAAEIDRAPRVPARRPAPRLAPPRIPGDGPAMRGTLVAQTERLDLYVGKNTFSPDQIAERAAKLERVLRAAEDQFGTTLKRRVSIGFYRVPPRRGVRGMAYTADRRVEVYYRPDEDLGRATTIVMHELGHHLEAQRYGEQNQRLADTILHEGMATWIAGIRWLDQCEASSWRERARQLKNAGVPLRLLTAERSGADNAYELWASFVDFLIRRYGWDAVDQLYASGSGRAPGSSNYRKILGKSLDELTSEWREWVAG